MTDAGMDTNLSPDILVEAGAARQGPAFEGQYLALVADIEVVAAPATDTVLAELRDGSRPIYRLVLIAAAVRDASVQFELWTDFSDTPLRLYAPLDRIGMGRHQLALVYARTRLDLYVDGVLMDEEYPIGRVALPAAGEWSADATAVSSVREFHRALAAAEVGQLAGGNIGERQSRYVGEWRQPAWGLQYWRPSGHNEYVADCQPVFAEGRFHLYYQRGRRSHGNKWGLGAHEKGHVSSTDLRHWEMHPIALGITEEWEGSLATGCTYYEAGTYYMFYTTRRPDRTQVVDLATSQDGVSFTKRGSSPMIEPQPPYKVGPFRDPHVFKGPDGCYHMLVTAALDAPDVDNHGGTLAHVSSPDLQNWTLEPPFLTPGYRDHEPECPDIFEWNGRHYLIFSHHGVAHYRVGETAFGPWSRPPVDTIDGVYVRVMQTAQFGAARRIGTAFLTPPGTFGGALIFREILQRPDGTLASAFPPELTPRGTPMEPGFAPLTGGAAGTAAAMELEARDTIAAAALRGAGGNVRVTATIEIGAGTTAFGIVLGGTANMRGGHELRFDVPRATVAWRLPRMKSWETPDVTSLRNVEGMTGPLTIELVRLGDVLDVCINGERTLAALQPAESGEDAFLYVQEGSVSIRDITVEALPEN